MTQQINEPRSVEDSADEALQHLKTILELGGLDAEPTLGEIDGDIVNLEIDGEDANKLVGPRGQVLDALQYLLLVMGTHDKPSGNRLRIHLDADGYRRRRADSLRALARQLADQVKASGEEAVLEPLNPMERRIVHTELVDDPDVETYSEGEEPNRHIVITRRS